MAHPAWYRMCGSGIPANAYVVDDVPASAPIGRAGCSRTWGDHGSFSWYFNETGPAPYVSRVGLHQLGGAPTRHRKGRQRGPRQLLLGRPGQRAYDEISDFTLGTRGSTCHRSKAGAHARMIKWPGSSGTVESEARAADGTTGFALPACSGAQTKHVAGDKPGRRRVPTLSGRGFSLP